MVKGVDVDQFHVSKVDDSNIRVAKNAQFSQNGGLKDHVLMTTPPLGSSGPDPPSAPGISASTADSKPITGSWGPNSLAN